jgi:hypothetical protein
MTHLNWASMTYLGEEGQPTAAAVGLASDNLDDTDASIEWEDAADLESDGAIDLPTCPLIQLTTKRQPAA